MLVHLLDIKKLQKTGGEEFTADASVMPCVSVKADSSSKKARGNARQEDLLEVNKN